MTEKELLYLEDAVCHEKSIIEICNSTILNVSSDYKDFFNNQITYHSNLLDDLINLMKEISHE